MRRKGFRVGELSVWAGGCVLLYSPAQQPSLRTRFSALHLSVPAAQCNSIPCPSPSLSPPFPSHREGLAVIQGGQHLAVGQLAGRVGGIGDDVVAEDLQAGRAGQGRAGQDN
jgi:uncharacterized protein GlcG (DUF336 family)